LNGLSCNGYCSEYFTWIQGYLFGFGILIQDHNSNRTIWIFSSREVTAGPQGLLPAEPAAGGQPGSVQRPGGKNGCLFRCMPGWRPRATSDRSWSACAFKFSNSGTVYLFFQTVLESAGYLASMSASAAPLPFDGRPCGSGVGRNAT